MRLEETGCQMYHEVPDDTMECSKCSLLFRLETEDERKIRELSSNYEETYNERTRN